MNRIAGTGLAAGALVIAGGTPIALLTQGAASASPLGTTSTATLAEEHLNDASGTDEAYGSDDETTEDRTTEDSTEDAADTTEGTEDSTEPLSGASMLGQAHAAAMKTWAHCVADAASGPKTLGQPMPPKTACGIKPLGPGQLMHQVPTTTVPVPTASDTTESSDTGSGDTGSNDIRSSDAKPEYDAPHADGSTTEHSDDSGWSEDRSDSTDDSGDQQSGGTASSDHESGHDD